MSSPTGLISSSKSTSLALIRVPKMRFTAASDGKVMLITWKQDRTRGEMTVRPPPGWPMAERSCISLTNLGACFFRSYQKSYSIHMRSSSSGGCAPYTSRLGMFRSSMKTLKRLPSTGPHMVYARPVSLSTPWRRFSNLPSRMSWVWLALVCAEKAMMIGSKLSPMPRASFCATVTVLAVPVGPMQSVCLWQLRSCSSSLA
mmetsp:Transcript_17838/g.51895  ORF Transcript_17838/g.51895 Transcript_17838/m.51895 type:complete len:201 (-) Transcript_17838:1781-2383(-)